MSCILHYESTAVHVLPAFLLQSRVLLRLNGITAYGLHLILLQLHS